MIQAVVQPGQREGLGMHYTSVENIMRVIRPLFLDDLHERFDQADTVRKLDRLLQHICEIKAFDPACGSGNFLVIAYKELRKLEHRILQRTGDLDPDKAGLFKLSGIKLDHFFGIEIDDFAHEIAILSLWLAKHQMNVEFYELFGVEISLIPLRDTGEIVCGNAARVDWKDVCPRSDGRVFVLGNPPYRGGKLQSVEQKADFVQYFGTEKYARNLDYISLWFLKGAEYIAEGNADLGFVSTSSAVQGDHVGLLWPSVLDHGVEISFAHQSFAWSNQAKGNAGVACVVIGLSADPPLLRKHYSGGRVRLVENINPYLKPASNNTIVHASSAPLNGLPAMAQGSRSSDNGHLTLTTAEKNSLLEENPAAEKFILKYTGSQEFLNGIDRYCLWIEDEDVETALGIPAIKRRLDANRAMRERGGTSALAVAGTPHRFGHRAHKPTQSVIVPRTSSERRPYIPMGFLDEKTVISDAAYAVYDAEPWVFGLIQSRMHMAWVDTVSGRLKKDYRYSAKLVYNTFPIPAVTESDKAGLTTDVLAVLEAREDHSDQTLGELYDLDKMPARLHAAHSSLDSRVGSMYRRKPFSSDEERVQTLLSMYEEMVAEPKETADA